MFSKNIVKGFFNLNRNSQKIYQSIGKNTLQINTQKNAKNWSLYTLATLGFFTTTYHLADKLSLDGFYEKEIPADFAEGEKRSIQVGPKEEDSVLVAKIDGKYYAVSNSCPHFGFSLAKGTMFGDKVSCSLHMAQFSVKTGEHEYGPVLNGLQTFDCEEKDGKIYLKVSKDKLNKGRTLKMSKKGDDARRFLIIGGGPAGLSAAETLRQSGFEGDITIVSSDKEAPYDRTMLSKTYGAKIEGITLRGDQFLKDYDINLVKNSKVEKIDTNKNFVQTTDGKHIHYEKILIATGSSPTTPPIPNVKSDGVFTVRTFEDVQKIKEFAKGKKNFVIIGASFIGLETASCVKDFMKDQQINLNVVTNQSVPLQVMGKEVGQAAQKIQEEQGVKFHLDKGIKSIQTNAQGKVTGVQLDDGSSIDADMVIMGTGVRPNTAFLKDSLNLNQDGGIQTDIFLKAKNQADVYAAGDVATYPWFYTGQNIRVEHYNEAIHQGYVAALNMLGKNQPNDNVPFFWTRFFNKSIQYTGYASKYDDVHIDGDISKNEFLIYYFWNNQVVAAACCGKMNGSMIINEAMKQNALPKAADIKAGRVTLADIEKKVKAAGHNCKCKKKKNLATNSNN